MSVHGSIVRRGGAWLPVLAVSSLGGAAVSLALPTVLGRAVDAIVSGSGVQRQLCLFLGVVLMKEVSKEGYERERERERQR